jgi:hypothetical protein
MGAWKQTGLSPLVPTVVEDDEKDDEKREYFLSSTWDRYPFGKTRPVWKIHCGRA